MKRTSIIIGRKSITISRKPKPDVENPYGYIYVTTNLINGKKYIGQHRGEVFDETYYGSGDYITKAIQKYGKENFIVEIIDWASNKLDLNLLEVYWIDLCGAFSSGMFYNKTLGGDGGDTWTGQSDKRKREISKILSEACSGEKNGNYGHRWNDEQRKNLSEYRKGMLNSEETKRKMGESQKKTWTEEKRKQYKDRWSGSGNIAARPVVQLSLTGEFIQEFSYAAEPKRLGIIKKGDVAACCRKEQKTAGGYKWMYKEDYDKLKGGE